jgi:methyltransferase family protein
MINSSSRHGLRPHCAICESRSEAFANAVVLRKYAVSYSRCAVCGFIQTEDPYWLDEAYSNPIADIDIGVVNRALGFSRTAQAVILSLFDCNNKFVDYGGGYGVFVRLMRDSGFDFYNFDKYCPNLFARTFEAVADTQPPYELVTAFEVFEHLPHPATDIQNILRFSRNVLLNTLVVPPSIPKPHEWWYYALDTGQHVSFYSLQSLRILAERHGLHFHSDGGQLHLFTERRISARLFRTLVRAPIARALIPLLRKRLRYRSLLAADFQHISGLRLT